MEDLQQALQKLLADPQQLSELSALAASFGFPPPDASEASSAAPPHPEAPLQPPTPSKPPIQRPSPPSGAPDDRREKLLLALKPFLKPSRQKKLDQALRIARLTHIAGSAFRGPD